MSRLGTTPGTSIRPYDGQPDIRRMIAAMRGEPTDRVPNFEVLIEDQHVEKLLGRWAGNTLAIGGDPAKGSETAAGARPMHPRDYLELCRIIGQDAILLEALWTPIQRRQPDGSVTAWSDRSFKRREDLAWVVWPDQADIEAKLRYVREYVAAARGTGIGVMFLCGCIFQTLYEFVVGLNDCMVMTIEQPSLLEELLARSADYFAELVRRAVAEDVDVVFLADDFAFNKGLFVEPGRFQRLWRPHFERIVEPARAAGKPILFHSDGRIDDAVEMLLEMGIDCLNPMDPSGVDYRDYKRRYGRRVTLSGNIDITWPLVEGTPQDVARDVKQHMAVLKPGGRWIAGSSHSIVNYIPHENFVAMINAIHEYGEY
jgi:uroporphyrinogen-III decarboxylase